MADSYEIRTVTDFFKVPEKKRQHCLKDFDLWMRGTDERERWFTSQPGMGFLANKSVFTWVDDGKHDVIERVTIVADREKQAHK